MPSPLGHALAGFAAGWMSAPAACITPWSPQSPSVEPRAFGLRLARRWVWPLTFAAAGMAADLDLLAGVHSRYTHSIGAALLVFAVAWLTLRRTHRRPAAVACALALSYGSHILLDWLGTDTTPPLGIMALWPFSGDFYLSPVPVFMGISRKYWLAAAWGQDATSVLRELFIVVPVALGALWVRPPRTPEPAAGSLKPVAGSRKPL